MINEKSIKVIELIENLNQKNFSEKILVVSEKPSSSFLGAIVFIGKKKDLEKFFHFLETSKNNSFLIKN